MLCNNFEMHYFRFFLTVEKPQVRKTNANKQRLCFRTQKIFSLFLLAAAKSSLLHWTDNFTILLTLLTSLLPVWTAPWSHETSNTHSRDSIMYYRYGYRRRQRTEILKFRTPTRTILVRRFAVVAGLLQAVALH